MESLTDWTKRFNKDWTPSTPLISRISTFTFRLTSNELWAFWLKLNGINFSPKLQMSTRLTDFWKQLQNFPSSVTRPASKLHWTMHAEKSFQLCLHILNKRLQISSIQGSFTVTQTFSQVAAIPPMVGPMPHGHLLQAKTILAEERSSCLGTTTMASTLRSPSQVRNMTPLICSKILTW